ncbi:endonuclease [Flavobacterium sp. H122]|uniref:endonuclease n=1 Tax=Flavobacterium sp. H122 TaxID=2529860 RepID=UPI0010AA66EF|nr:endonuclease [Flavobacterium sp. H122]
MNKLFLLLLSCTFFAQVPKNYYSTATGNGYQLKTQLHKIISNHKDLGYGGLWQTYKTADVDDFYEKDNSVLDIYSENPKGKDLYTFKMGSSQCGIYSSEGDCYNREHIIPQSVFNSASPMVSDAHFIPPTDGKVNGMRSNYPHGNVASVKWTSENGGKLGTSNVNGYKGTVFEPIDEFKGDIARMYFYFATRYEDKVTHFNYDMFNGNSNQVFTDAFRNMLLQWHKLDPVNEREIKRNNAIQKRQGNRNPFIDHPEFVEQIWGKSSLIKTAANKKTAIVKTEKKVLSKNKKNPAAVSSSNIAAGNLYFSAYIEGSKNNKALIITNGTTKSINLNDYSIKKQTNGKGNWSDGLRIRGKLAPKQSLTLVYSSSKLNCTNSNILRLNSTELAFNGNDPLGLFFNTTLIDCLGDFNDAKTFSENQTLKRKKTNNIPSADFNKTDWEILPIDSCQ